MSSAPLHLEPAAIAFGTDGWRGVLGVDITIERLLPVAAAAAAELAHSAPPELESRTVVIGYDRRFLAPELAAAIAAAARGLELLGARTLAHARLQLGGGAPRPGRAGDHRQPQPSRMAWPQDQGPLRRLGGR